MNCLKYWHRWRAQAYYPKVTNRLAGFKIRTELDGDKLNVYVTSTGENPHYPASPEELILTIPSKNRPMIFNVSLEELILPRDAEQMPEYQYVQLSAYREAKGSVYTASAYVCRHKLSGNFIDGP